MKKVIERVVVNGEKLYTGEFYDKFIVYAPTKEEPYWLIKGIKGEKEILTIKATGAVCYEIEYEPEGGE